MTPNDQRISPKIAVVCVESSGSDVRKTISYHVPGWDQADEIVVVTIPDQWRAVKPEIFRIIDKAIPKTCGCVQMLILNGLTWTGSIGEDDDDLRRPNRIASLDGFTKKLPAFLRCAGLDLLSVTERKLSKWRHGVVDKNRISLWLRQFAEAGSNEWIGEGLLKALDFWPEDRLIASVALTSAVLNSFNHVCLHRSQSGKSADVLANLFTKQIKPLNPKFAGIEDFSTVLDARVDLDGESILFLEDGLFTGTEMTKLFSDLLGQPVREGRKAKADPLKNRDGLTARRITLLFPAATSLGVARLTQFLRDRNLSNIEVMPCAKGHYEVLTPLGQEAIKNGTFVDTVIGNCPVDPDSHLIKMAFQDLDIWKTEDRVTRAIAFCKEIGQQLFQSYLDSMDYKWEPEKVRRCALGMYGIGMAFAFAHSVPKVTLPLIWAGGKVQFQTKSINWIPLFPNAA